jgi:DNA anti-recombination protein RmuC
MPYRKINDTTRARIIADLLSGNYQTDLELSTRYQCSPNTIGRIRKHLDPALLLAFVNEKAELDNARRELDELINSIPARVTQLLSSSLEAAAKIAEQVSNEEWRNKQSATELAELYDSLTNTAIKILAAVERANEKRALEAGRVGPPTTQNTDERT